MRLLLLPTLIMGKGKVNRSRDLVSVLCQLLLEPLAWIALSTFVANAQTASNTVEAFVQGNQKRTRATISRDTLTFTRGVTAGNLIV